MKHFLCSRLALMLSGSLFVATSIGAALLTVLLFGSCASQMATRPSGEAATARFAEAPTDHPGLGTKWGETRASRVGFTDFVRANPAHPIATATIYYNDAAGVRAMVGAVAWRYGWPLLPAPVQSGSRIVRRRKISQY